MITPVLSKIMLVHYKKFINSNTALYCASRVKSNINLKDLFNLFIFIMVSNRNSFQSFFGNFDMLVQFVKFVS